MSRYRHTYTDWRTMITETGLDDEGQVQAQREGQANLHQA